MPNLSPEIKYAVGIDFGHGECSAAFCEIGWGKSSTLLERPADIRLYGNDKFTIPSAYSVSSEGKMLAILLLVISEGLASLKYPLKSVLLKWTNQRRVFILSISDTSIDISSVNPESLLPGIM